jgi:hypothetical protein
MTSTRQKQAAKRAAVRTATYYNYGVKPTTSEAKANFASFAVGVFLTLGIYLLARFFGI